MHLNINKYDDPYLKLLVLIVVATIGVITIPGFARLLIISTGIVLVPIILTICLNCRFQTILNLLVLTGVICAVVNGATYFNTITSELKPVETSKVIQPTPRCTSSIHTGTILDVKKVPCESK